MYGSCKFSHELTREAASSSRKEGDVEPGEVEGTELCVSPSIASKWDLDPFNSSIESKSEVP